MTPATVESVVTTCHVASSSEKPSTSMYQALAPTSSASSRAMAVLRGPRSEGRNGTPNVTAQLVLVMRFRLCCT